MSLSLAAQHLQSQGRGDDDHLVHMTTGELHALNELAKKHGHSLTINPKTGLPEAGFLSMLLPMALGAVIDPALISAGLTSTEAGLATAGIVGLGDYAMTGSLGQGIMAGFGAYSGGNLEQSIANFGSAGDQAAANITASTTPAVTPTSNAIAPETSTALTPDAQPLSQAAPNYNLNTQGFPQNTPVGTQTLPGGGGAVAGPQSFSTGLSNVAADPMGYLKAPGNLFKVGSAAVPLALAAAKSNMPTPYTLNAPSIPNPLKLNSPNFQASIPAQPTPPYQAQYNNYVTNPYTAKSGGLMDVKNYASAGSVSSNYKDIVEAQKIYDMFNPQQDKLDTSHNVALANAKPNAGIYELSSSDYLKTTPLKMFEQNQIKVSPDLLSKTPLGAYNLEPAAVQAKQDIASDAPSFEPYAAAHGGIMHGGLSYHGSDLGNYSDGGHLLKGPGDGVSDSIPATIGGHQPARLAEGEFVIPARIVSELGNGSTDAGAKRLYEMMDRIKAKRAKTKDIAADTKAYKFLPA